MKNHIFFYSLIMLAFISCQKDDPNIDIEINSLTGYVQKGPFISGTSITINELDNHLNQTGKVFTTQVIDNLGGFEISSLKLKSGYISLRADGFYFNEVTGEESSAQLTLHAVTDLKDKNSVNVNLLSTLEKPRVEYLMKDGASFSMAKKQAQAEVLRVFNINDEMEHVSEMLDISEDGKDNGILLAVSLILQGYRTDAELTRLLSGIGTDIREDGQLNDSTLGSELINHAIYLDSAIIKNNLTNRYEQLGVEKNIPDFDDHINHFLANTKFNISKKLILYPETGIYGPNILNLDKSNFQGGVRNKLSVAANLDNGASLKLVLTCSTDQTLGYTLGSEKNWNLIRMDGKTFILESIQTGKPCDLRIVGMAGECQIDYYEMNAPSPVISRTVHFN